MATSSPEPIHPFEAILETDGKLHFAQVPEDEAVLSRILQAIAQTQPFGELWNSDYRTQYLLAGLAGSPVTTLEDVQAIAVPHWRRLRGHLQGNQFSLTSRETSPDGEVWEPFPVFEDTREEAKHPAFALRGKVIGQFLALHWHEGRIDLEPDPPGELLEVLESVVQSLNGDGDPAWQQRHEAFGGDPKVRPAAKRSTLEVRELAPLFSAATPPFARQFGLEFWPLVPLEYSADGKKWLKYPLAGDLEEHESAPSAAPPAQPDPASALAALLGGQAADEEEGEEDPFGLLSSLFDLQTVQATVYADGRVEWDEDALAPEQAEGLRHSFIQTTGAGTADWATHLAELVPEGQAGVPQAVRMQVMKQLLDAAPDMLDQAYAPSAISMNGTDWLNISPAFMLDDDDEVEEA